MEAFARWVRHVYTNEICLDLSFYSRTNEAAAESWDDIAMLNWESPLNVAYPMLSRPEFYLRCTQLGLFPTTVNSVSLFGTTIGQDLYFEGCRDAFNGDFNFLALSGAVDALNVQFGGRYPAVSNVVYTNGELDMYYNFGITDGQNQPPYIPIFNIPRKFWFFCVFFKIIFILLFFVCL